MTLLSVHGIYVLRDYLRALGEPLPRLGGLARRILVNILTTDSLVHKLIGMQLLTESNALSIFKGLVDARVEPVLAELLPYYERDEARHVGLGVMYLPRLLARQTAAEAARAAAFQLSCLGLLISAGLTMRDDFAALGMDQRKMSVYTIKLQDQIVRDMMAAGARGARGLLNRSRSFGPAVLDFVHPPAAVAPWHRAALRLWRRGASWADQVLA